MQNGPALGGSTAVAAQQLQRSGKNVTAGNGDVASAGRNERKSVMLSERKGQKDARLLQLQPSSLACSGNGASPKLPYDVSLKVDCVCDLKAFASALDVPVVVVALHGMRIDLTLCFADVCYYNEQQKSPLG